MLNQGTLNADYLSEYALHDRREFYARHALHKCQDDLEQAQLLAEMSYREFVRRGLYTTEINDIHVLIQELNGWSKATMPHHA